METESPNDVRRLTDGYQWSDEEDIALAAFLELYRAAPYVALEVGSRCHAEATNR